MTAQEALYALGVMSGVFRYCPNHEVYFRGTEPAETAMPYYDKYLSEVSQFFGSPVAFYTALKYVRASHEDAFCRRCTRAVGFV